MINRQTTLSRNIVQFCRFLRQRNFSIGLDEELTALRALQYIDYSSNPEFQLALRAVLCKSQAQLSAFDELFRQYWKELTKALDSKEKIKEQKVLRPAPEATFKTLKSWLNSNRNTEEEETAAYSAEEQLSKKDFSQVPAEEIEELMRLIRALSRRLAAQVARRYQKANGSALPDLRRTLRHNMRRGGELLHILSRKPKQNRTRVVVLCDLSKSMELYSAFLLQFLYAFQNVYSRMESFVFGTTLQQVTSLLRHHDFAYTMRLMHEQSDEWGSGTRIGESLEQFVNDYATRLLNKRTVVIILSDGWDSGDAEKVGESLKHIKALSKKVIWLTPLAGFSDYRPDTAGMKAALPYINVLAPVHNAESLRQLSRWL